MALINIMAVRHSAFYSPLLMTMAGGYLKAEGLDYRYAVQTPENTVADNIEKGNCQVAQSAVAVSFSALEAGQQNSFVHFAQINGRDGFFLAGRQQNLNFRWQDLQGKKVLVDHFFQPLAMLKYGLHQQNIDYASLNVIDAGDVSAIEQAFRQGQADFVHMQGPAAQQLVRDGIAEMTVAVGELLGPVAFSSLCAGQEWLASDEALAFMRAYKKATIYAISAPADELANKQKEAGFFREIDVNVLTDTISAYQSLNTWSENPVIPKDAYQNLLDVFLYNGLITKSYAYEELICQPPGD